MANGKTHEKLNISFLVFAILVAATVFNKSRYIEGIFIIIGYLIGTFYLNPDLDLPSRPFKRWGILKFIWYPYQTFKHRSIWTHGYIIGDLIRYSYMMSVLIIPVMLFNFLPFVSTVFLIKDLLIFIEQYKIVFFLIIVGNVLSSAVHTLTDQTSSKFKKMTKIKTQE
ncbi:metal-binding protein [Bacillus mexicanus]|uniref:metal-binding protein n=1 Tax=Bacillus mexicanus TaxID=2834415 RepID=UPI003D1EE176